MRGRAGTPAAPSKRVHFSFEAASLRCLLYFSEREDWGLSETYHLFRHRSEHEAFEAGRAVSGDDDQVDVFAVRDHYDLFGSRPVAHHGAHANVLPYQFFPDFSEMLFRVGVEVTLVLRDLEDVVGIGRQGGHDGNDVDQQEFGVEVLSQFAGRLDAAGGGIAKVGRAKDATDRQHTGISEAGIINGSGWPESGSARPPRRLYSN